MDDLIAFLRQCLDREEQVIREAAGHYFYAEGHGDAINRWFDRWSPDNPDGMIAEVKAKRLMLDECEGKIERGRLRTEQGGNDEMTPGMAYMALAILPLLAQPYAGWPGWREEWRA